MNNIVSENVNIYSLKSLLRGYISLYEEKKKIRDDNNYYIEIYKEIISLVSGVDVKGLLSNYINISLLLPLVYDEEADYMSQRILEYCYKLVSFANDDDFKDEYKKCMKSINMIIKTIITDYENAINKKGIYENEVKELSGRQYVYRGILYKLNKHEEIDEYKINEIKKLLNESNYSEKDKIIILEHIRNHNIKCKGSNKKPSYTTIRMIESDFSLYDTDEVIDKRLKNNLDECALSIFNTMMTESDIDIPLFLEETTSWLNNRECFDYTIKKALNNFINGLKECRENMISDNNYYDQILRAVIIEEYNSYYYKYLSLKNYYEEKLKQRDCHDEKVQVEEKKFYFAKSGPGSATYIEKDIENIPYEYYERVKKLLERFKNNTLPNGNIERFSSTNQKLSRYLKLKEDQIRILISPLGDNSYLIVGAMLKKKDNATKDYIRLVGRDYLYEKTQENYLESRNFP